MSGKIRYRVNALVATCVLSAYSVCSNAQAASATRIVNCGGTSANVAWVYHDGAMSQSWPFDYSYGALVMDYKDTTGMPRTGSRDIKVTGPIYGGWQPASRNYKFDITGCKYLTFALKPTVANQKWASYFMYENDIPTKVTLDITARDYGPSNPAKGQWNVYKIPLVDFFPNGVVPQLIYKFSIQDISGNGGSHNIWYIDDVGFTGK